MDDSKITQEEFNEALDSLLKEITIEEFLKIPGIKEIVSKEFNNEVLQKIGKERK